MLSLTGLSSFAATIVFFVLWIRNSGEDSEGRQKYGTYALVSLGVFIVMLIVAPTDEIGAPTEPSSVSEPAQTEPTKEPDVKTVTETMTVAFEIIGEEDANLAKGQTEIRQEGRDGIKEITYEVLDGGKTKTGEKILVEPTNEITAIAPKVQPIELSGTDQQASEKFMLEEGLSVFRMAHSGQSNFAIELLGSGGELVELLVNEIGSFNGSKAVRIDSGGEFVLDITASGGWVVKIEQPRPKSAPEIPKTLAGEGPQASEFIHLDSGLTTFKMAHSGSSYFAIALLDKEGYVVELLVNEIGSFDGSKAIAVPSSGIYILDIATDGDWTISIE